MRVSHSRWLGAIVIFVLSLLLRAPMLGSFITIDEPFWIEKSQNFAAALFVPNLECQPVDHGRPNTARGLGCTLQVGFPGVTTMWVGVLGLLGYYWYVIQPTGLNLVGFLQTSLIDPLDPVLMMWMRLPLAILSSAFIAVFYILLSHLLTTRVAVIASLVLVVQPLHVALSRVLHHDALNTTFMLLSILPLIGYWLRGWKWYWLIFSGIMAGLAFLGKPVSWLLWPYAAILGGFSLFYSASHPVGDRRSHSLGRLLKEAAKWSGAAVLTFVVLYPAMWVIPGQVVAVMLGQNIELADAGHTHYFLGQISDDPGPWFYPVAWLWQASPLEVLGLLALPLMALHILPPKRWGDRPVELALLLFLVMLSVLETIVNKKMLRYFLPAFPVIAVFVAYGLLWLADKGSMLFLKRQTHWTVPLVAGLIVLVQGGLTLGHFPYYFTYYNPLLGGPAVVAHLMTVGWGEGLDQAAAYFNRMPNAPSLAVSSWYTDSFHPYFAGQHASFSDDGRGQLAADYVVFYINQIQRQKPYPGLVDYFRAGKPVFVVNVGPFGWDTDLSKPDALHWVEVYKAPAAQSASGAPKIEGVAQLLAYKVTGGRVAGSKVTDTHLASLSPDDVSVVLFLRALGPLPEGAIFTAAFNDDQRWGQWQFTAVEGEWREGSIIEWHGVLALPEEMPPGEYRFWAALQSPEGEVIAEFPISEKDPSLEIR